MEATSGLEPLVQLLQSRALPLGYPAVLSARTQYGSGAVSQVKVDPQTMTRYGMMLKLTAAHRWIPRFFDLVQLRARLLMEP